MCRHHRYDVLLPLDQLVLRAAQSVLDGLAPLIMEAVGDECFLCELTGLVSNPGSDAQPVHHDIQFDESSPRLTILIALQDTTKEMGPTIFFPGTNTPEWHCAFAERSEQLEDLFEGTPHVVEELAVGDAVVYDARVLHCGGANTSHRRVGKDRDGHAPDEVESDEVSLKSNPAGKRRTMLVLSAQEEDGASKGGHTNIRPGYRKKYRIADFRSWTM